MDTVTFRYRINMVWWIQLRSGTEFIWCGGYGYAQVQNSHAVVDTVMLRYRILMLWWIQLRSGTEFTCCCGYGYTQVQIGFPVVITLRVITRNTFFHLRRSITLNYAFITFTKEILVSRN